MLHLPHVEEHRWHDREIERIAKRCRGGVAMQRDYSVDTGALTLTAGQVLYMIGLKTASTSPIDIIGIIFGGDSQNAGSMKVEAVTWTSDGTGTSSTPKPYNGDAQLLTTPATTAKVNYSVGPGGTVTVIRTWIQYVPVGIFELLLPLGREYTVPVSTFYGLRCTPTTASFNGNAAIIFEE
jgi:hypothetical protein